MDTLRAERRKLVQADADSYNPDAFPGSAEWRKNKIARDTLATFDAAHPEVVVAIRAERPAAKYDSLSDFAKHGS